MFRRIVARAVSSRSRGPGGSCRSVVPSLSRARADFRVIFVSCEPNTTSARPFTQSTRGGLAAPRSTSRQRVSDVVSVEYRHAIKEALDPVVWKASPALLTQDFVRHQVSLTPAAITFPFFLCTCICIHNGLPSQQDKSPPFRHYVSDLTVPSGQLAEVEAGTANKELTGRRRSTPRLRRSSTTRPTSTTTA
jgi:hypothetical protein